MMKVLSCALVVMGLTGLNAVAMADQPAGFNAAQEVDVDITPQPLRLALTQFAQQTGVQLLFSEDEVPLNMTAPRVVGTYTLREALEELLAQTTLRVQFINARTVAIRTARPAQSSATSEVTTEEMRVAQAHEGASDSDSVGSPAKDQNPRSKSPSTSNAAEGELEEILVTATKRTERIQDVPASIAVISGQDIERRGLIGMEDYLRSIPGVNQLDRGLDNAIVIRGITTSPQSENFGSGTTVASYFDETPITGAGGQGAGGIDLRPVDIERIEVLRGPQGTAYGSASLGGAMRVIPAKPRLNGFDARVAAAHSNTGGFGSNNSMIQGVVNIPVANTFAVRAVGYRFDESGFYRNSAASDPATLAFADTFGLRNFVEGFTQNDVGQMVSVGGRIAALWKPTDKLDFSVNYLTQQIEQDGRPEAGLPLGGGKFEQAHIPVAVQGRVRGEAGELADSEIDLVNFVLNYDLGWAGLTSTASWIDSGSVFVQTFGPRNSAVFGLSSTTGRSLFDSFSAETRLASKLDGRFHFLGGLFYEAVEDTLHQSFDWPGPESTNPFSTNPLFLFDSTRELDQRAVFGEVSFDLTSKLTATAGGRYFRYDKEEQLLREGGFLGVPLGAGVGQSLQSSEDGSTFKAHLGYKPTPDALVYAAWSEGFRLGRPDAGLSSVCDANSDGLVDGTSLSIASTRQVNSDFLENYELGSKISLFNRRMVIDSAVYHIKWDGLPIRSIAPTCGLAYVANAGAATSDGVEFQASLTVTDGFRLDFGGGYVRAELSKDAPGIAGSPREGARLPGAPKVSANLAAQYDFDVAGYEAFVRADSFYTGEFYGDLLKTPGTKAGDYIKVDARAGVVIKNLSVELFVRNLTNEDEFTWRGISVREPDFGFRMRPRTVGLQLGYRFK